MVTKIKKRSQGKKIILVAMEIEKLTLRSNFIPLLIVIQPLAPTSQQQQRLPRLQHLITVIMPPSSLILTGVNKMLDLTKKSSSVSPLSSSFIPKKPFPNNCCFCRGIFSFK